MKITNLRYNYCKVVIYIYVVLFVVLISVVQCRHCECGNSLSNTAVNRDNSKNIRYVIFSPKKYAHERHMVVSKEHITKKQLRAGKIYISLIDLNGDGQTEILSYIDIPEYCGNSTGCPLNIYKVVDNNLTTLLPPGFGVGFPLFMNMDGLGRQSIIGVIHNESGSWDDITLGDNVIWKWNGNNYSR